jgi:hypothetical protein
MATKFKILMNGKREEYPARRFSHYIDNVQFWFALHKPVDYTSGLTISHWATGKRVLHIGPTALFAGVGMKDQDIARAELTKFANNKGQIRVAEILRAAEAAEQAHSTQ